MIKKIFLLCVFAGLLPFSMQALRAQDVQLLNFADYIKIDKVSEKLEFDLGVNMNVMLSETRESVAKEDSKIHVEINFDEVPFEKRLELAKANDKESIVMLAWRYYLGVTVKKNLEEALKYCNQAKALGFHDLNSLRFSLQTKLDILELLKSGEDSAILKAQSGDAKSAHLLALAYLNGKDCGVEKNLSEAAKYFELSAKLGYPQAFLDYAEILLVGEYVEKNEEEAFKWFKKVEEANLDKFYATLAAAYFYGINGFQKNPEKALEYLKKGEALGADQSFLSLARIYDYGLAPLKKDESLAEKYYILAASQGKDESLLAIINFYDRRHDDANLLKWARKGYSFDMKAAPSIICAQLMKKHQAQKMQAKEKEKADLKAQVEHGTSWDVVKKYLNFASKDEEKSLLKTFALEKNNDEAISRLIDVYGKSFDSEKDTQDFEKLFEIAKSKNVAKAYFVKANLIDKKKLKEVSDDVESLLNKASELGSGEASYKIANKFFVEKDMQNALAFLKKASDQNLPDAQFAYGVANVKGDFGLEKNEEKGIALITLAANANLPNALFYLGRFYASKGDGVKTVDYYQKAAFNGKTQALFYLACLYSNGELVEKDEKKAFVYMRSATQSNVPQAFYQLAGMYFDGIGTEKNEEYALFTLYKGAHYDINCLKGYLSFLVNAEDRKFRDVEIALPVLKELALWGESDVFHLIVSALAQINPPNDSEPIETYAYAKCGILKTPDSKFLKHWIDYIEKKFINESNKAEYEKAVQELSETLKKGRENKTMKIPASAIVRKFLGGTK